MRKVLMVFAMAGALALAACGGGGDDSSGVKVPDELAAAAPAAAESAVLTLDDFPTGWTSTPADEDEDGETPELSEGCSSLFPEETPGEVAKADSDDFEGPDDQKVSSSARVFESEEAARDRFDAVKEGVARCRDEVEGVFAQSLSEQMGEDVEQVLQGLDVSLADLAVPALGDQAAGFRLTIELSLESLTFQFAFDLIGIRQGQMIASLSYLSFGEPDEAEEQAVTEILADKLEAAAAALPQ